MNSTVQRMNSLMPVNIGAVSSGSNGNVGASSAASSWNKPLVWFMAFLVIFLCIFAVYYEAFMRSLQNWTDSLNMWFTGKGYPPEPEPIPAKEIPIVRPSPPQDENNNHATGMEGVVERVLPPAKDLFTISKNEYSYYDAAPLCKALGAELATYDEVKKAWQKGADWCNYGWVKGQMAVYPTQKSSYEELQQGPADQRGACGKPGVNGGYFDNPEMKFGVTCSGRRPAQKQHDATSVISGSTRPLSASGLEFEKKVQQFKVDADSIGVLPFSKDKWSS